MAKRILVAVIFVPLLFVVMFFLPPIVMTVVVAFISALACYELLRAAGEGKVSLPMKAVSVLAAAAIPFGAWLNAAKMTVGACAFLVMAVSFECAIHAYDENESPIGFYHVMLTLFGGILIPTGLSSLVVLKCMEHGKYLVLLAVMLAFITDGGAYFAGVFFGRHRGITRVSPNKSLEGYIGGFLTGIIAALVYGLIVRAASGMQVHFLPLVLCGLFGAAATELGDLSFSLIKRQYGVKDYGHLLPGHGGMLDRFDSMIFCAPVVMFIVMLLPVF